MNYIIYIQRRKYSMNNFRNKNAITLVALVITIIIMLLLAVVAIQLTIGENGLIAKSTQAKTQ